MKRVKKLVSSFLLLVVCPSVVLFSLIFSIEGCYGTFRTAEVLKEGEGCIELNVMCYYDNMDKLVYDLPCFIYRRGLGDRADLGFKFYFLGFTPELCFQLLQEGKYIPAIAVQGGIGSFGFTPYLVKVDIIASKKFRFLSFYTGVKVSNIPTRGIFGGLCFYDCLFLESYYGNIHIEHIDFLGSGSYSEDYPGFVVGAGLRFKWGGKKAGTDSDSIKQSMR